METDAFYPVEGNLGRPCLLWDPELTACTSPRRVLYERRSCEGEIDEVCLFLQYGRPPEQLDAEQAWEIDQRAPGSLDSSTPLSDAA